MASQLQFHLVRANSTLAQGEIGQIPIASINFPFLLSEPQPAQLFTELEYMIPKYGIPHNVAYDQDPLLNEGGTLGDTMTILGNITYLMIQRQLVSKSLRMAFLKAQLKN